jgi:hypothetical protein
MSVGCDDGNFSSPKECDLSLQSIFKLRSRLKLVQGDLKVQTAKQIKDTNKRVKRYHHCIAMAVSHFNEVTHYTGGSRNFTITFTCARVSVFVFSL